MPSMGKLCSWMVIWMGLLGLEGEEPDPLKLRVRVKRTKEAVFSWVRSNENNSLCLVRMVKSVESGPMSKE